MKQIRPLVKEILEEYPSARDDDFILVALVYQPPANPLETYIYEGVGGS